MDIHFKFGNQFNSWSMAILAILLLGVGTFGMIAGVAKKDKVYKFGSLIMLLCGVGMAVICLINEGAI